MKLVLCIFEQLSGLKINFHKSELFCFGIAKDDEEEYRNIFGCAIGPFPFRYLGIPIHFHRLKNGEWKPVEDRFEKKISELDREDVILWGPTCFNKLSSYESSHVHVILL
jgi:hypothetical protein